MYIYSQYSLEFHQHRYGKANGNPGIPMGFQFIRISSELVIAQDADMDRKTWKPQGVSSQWDFPWDFPWGNTWDNPDVFLIHLRKNSWYILYIRPQLGVLEIPTQSKRRLAGKIHAKMGDVLVCHVWHRRVTWFNMIEATKIENRIVRNIEE